MEQIPIPKSARSAILSLIRLSPADFAAFLQALSRATPVLDEEKFWRHVVPHVPQIDPMVIKSIMKEILQMAEVLHMKEETISDFASAVANGALSASSESFPITDNDKTVLTDRLIQISKVWSIVHFGSDPEDLTEAEFNELAEQWRGDTRYHSSLSKKFTHAAYVTIIGAGKTALPLILRELERELDHWFYALRYIVRRDVAVGAETMEDARIAWLNWGRENHYI